MACMQQIYRKCNACMMRDDAGILRVYCVYIACILRVYCVYAASDLQVYCVFTCGVS